MKIGYLCIVTNPIYPNESAGVTDWRKGMQCVLKIDGCLLFHCVAGRALVATDMRKTVFRRGDLLVLTADVFFSVAEVSADFSARYLSLSQAMIETAYYRIPNKALWDRLHEEPILRLSPDQRRLAAGWMDQAEWMLANLSGYERAASLSNNVYNLFVAVAAELGRSDVRTEPRRKDRAWAIVCRFWLLLARHACSERSVGFYADALHITSCYLNKVCRRTCGVSPKAMIDQQLVVEMKCLLADTHLAVAEIAGRLHFEDASYMCRFFRRMTGRSPLEFRHALRRADRAGG